MRKIVRPTAALLYALLPALMLACTPAQQKPVITTVQHPLGMGWFDTLVVAAQTSECGEWGGHRDIIKVYLDSEQAQKKGVGYESTDSVPRIAAWFRDTLCPASLPGRHLFLAGRHALTTDQEKAIFQYMQQLLPYGLKMPYPAHAGDFYSVRTTAKQQNKVAISFYDTRNEWHEFGPLRQLLFPR